MLRGPMLARFPSQIVKEIYRCRRERHFRSVRRCLSVSLSTQAETQAIWNEISKSLGVNTPEDWYKIRGTDILRLDSGILRPHGNSLSLALEKIYPEHDWQPWRFREGGTNRKRLWEDPNTRRKFLDYVKQDLGYISLDQLYHLNKKSITSRGGWLLLRRAKNSVIRLVQSSYPEHEWLPWKFSHIGPATWNDEQNVKKFFQWAQESQLKLDSLEGWYHVRAKQIQKLGGSSLLQKKFKGSLTKALMTVFPSHDWLEWKFHSTPMKWWEDIHNQRKYMNWLGETILKVESMEDWYKLRKSHLATNYGSRLIGGYYKNSCFLLLQSCFPNHDWLEWKFHRCPKGFWTDAKNRRRFLEYFLRNKNIDLANSTVDSIVEQVSPEDIIAAGGPRLFP